MQFISEVLASALLSTVLLAALGYVLRSTIGEWMIGAVRQKFAKELEEHKANVKSVADVRLERMKAELQIEAARQQTRFSEQHTKVAEAVVGVHAKIDDAFNAVADYTKVFEPAGGATKADRRETVNETINELRQFYYRNRIYLPTSLAERVKDLHEQLFDAASTFSMKVEHGRDEDDSIKTWTNTFNRLKNDILPLLRDLEDDFRRMLGIEDMVPTPKVAEQRDEPAE